jgi:glycosyltransferase involved in cell wall biosynthesis
MNPSVPVVYIITKLELGGAQKICLSLFKDRAHQGVPTYLITGNQGTLINEVNTLPNVFFIKSLKREITWYKTWLEMITFISVFRIVRKLKKQHPDLVVHTHGSKAGVIGRLAATLARVKNRIHTVHGFPFNPHQKLLPWLGAYCAELLCAPLTSHFVCVSQMDVQTGKRLLPGFSKKCSIIRAAVDSEYFYVPARNALPHPSPYEPFIFGTISCMKPQKNLMDMLKAFAYVYQHNPRARLEIIGDGIERKMLENWILKHGLTNVITLHGWQHDVLPFLKKWHCFALSSLWEGLPCAIIEARLAKLPILSYDTGGIREVVHHGVNGFVYPQKEWGQLAQGMLALSADELLFMTLRTYPDNFKDFDLKVMVDKHMKLYKTLSR